VRNLTASIHAEFAAKLRLTAAVLGNATHKGLCALFRAVNPNTPCDLDRLHKWIQGRALPRSTQLYEDWAKVLGTDRSGSWLATCSINEFRDEIALLYGASLEDMHRTETPRVRSGAVNGTPADPGGLRTLYGTFACYSLAWSPHYAGQLIRGALRLKPGKGSALRATYTEALIGGPVQMVGDVVLNSGTLHMLLRNPDTGLPASLILIMPGPPASVLCGILSSQAFVAHHALPTASRMLVVRVPDAAQIDKSNRYLDFSPSCVSGDLDELGLALDTAGPLDALAAAFLGRGIDQISPIDQASFSSALDPLYFLPPAGKAALRIDPAPPEPG
jgi:hypothetical protein